LSLIDAITLLHQHQRERRTEDEDGESVEQVVVSLDDIALANELAHEVLGQTLDELPPQTRRMLDVLDAMVTRECEAQGIDRCDYRFRRRQLREELGLGHEQVRVHLGRLVELEYVVVHRGRRGKSFEYELVYDGRGKDGRRFLMNLLDVEELRGTAGKQGDSDSNLPGSGTDLPGSQGHLPGSNRPQTGPKPGGCRSAGNGPQGPSAATTAPNPLFGPQKTRTGWVERPLSTSPVVDVGVSD
jgi:DNA-binding transcriptional ArsR family regulator